MDGRLKLKAMEGKDDAKPGALAAKTMPSAVSASARERRSTNGSLGGGIDLSEENVDAFYKKMLVRAPNKRQVKILKKWISHFIRPTLV